jgi:hypothetical protein
MFDNAKKMRPASSSSTNRRAVGASAVLAWAAVMMV